MAYIMPGFKYKISLYGIYNAGKYIEHIYNYIYILHYICKIYMWGDKIATKIYKNTPRQPPKNPHPPSLSPSP